MKTAILLWAMLCIAVSAQTPIRGKVTDVDYKGQTADVAVDRQGNIRISKDPTVYYWVNSTVTNIPTGAPFRDLLNFTNISNGVNIPRLISVSVWNYDGYPIDFLVQPFYSPPTNGTYSAGTVVTNYGLDAQYLLPWLTQRKATNAYGHEWETNANVVGLMAQPVYHDIPTSSTNMPFLIINKGSACYFTNGAKWLFVFSK